MKILGIVLVWVGVVYLLKNIGIIQIVNWNIIWPVLIIIVGLSLKHCKHGISCVIGNKCGKCDGGSAHKCVGPDCTH